MTQVTGSLFYRILQRIQKVSPFLIAFIALLYIGWSLSVVWVYPDDGVRNLTPTGYIAAVDTKGPSIDVLHVGDIVISVDGVLYTESKPFYAGRIVGEVVEYVVNRNDEVISIPVTLYQAPLIEQLRRFTPLLVAIIFWIVSVAVQAYAPVRDPTRLLTWLFLAIALLITSGQVSNVGPGRNSDLYNFLAWLIGPLAVHFHLNFPQTSEFKGSKLIGILLYCLGFAGGLTYLIWGSSVVRSHIYFPLSLTVSRLLLTLSLLLVIGLLVYSYIHAESAGVKAKIRIVVLGGVISILPLVTLVFLPEVLFNKPLQQYAFVLSWIGILPITYGYAIFRYHLIEIERHVNRGATYLLVFSILIICYLLLSFGLYSVLPGATENEPFIDMLMVLILATIIVPIYQRVQKIVDTVFYGGWYDYRSAVSEITSGLEQITDLKTLANIISERLVTILRIEDTCVFLCDQKGDFSVIEVAPHEHITEDERILLPVLPRSSLQYLLKIGKEERASLEKALSEVTLSTEEQQLLNSEQVHLWVPVIGHGQVKGFLALGPKYGGDIFSAEDVDILRIVARQVAPVIENIHLLTELRQHTLELESRVIERTAELYDAKERVEAILSSVGDGVFVTDLERNLLTVNAALERQSGYIAADIIGKKLEILLADENAPQLLKEMQETLHSGEIWTGELVNRRKNGVKYDIHLTLAPVRDQVGQILSYVGSLRDITHQKELDRLKDIFVADVSHELRTPTTNINLYLDLLETAPPEKRTIYLRVLKEQSLLLRKLVEDILDLSRLAIGKTRKSDFTVIDINLLAEQVVTAYQPLAQLAGIDMHFIARKPVILSIGEYNQLSRVLTNLVANSIQYTNNGFIKIETFQGDDSVGFIVEDSGIGIEEDDMVHIFERFYRGKQVRQSRIHGTGLGLAIVKEIVDLHGGEVHVFSESGKGTRFIIELPLYLDKVEVIGEVG